MNLRFLLLLLVCILPVRLSAQYKIYQNEAGFKTDNDGFLLNGSDRYYTAGNFIYFNHALKLNPTDSAKLENRVLGFEAGQKIYTAQSGYIPGPNYIDRPFAGYLYMGSSLNLLYKNETNLRLEAQVGVIGPRAYGMQVQDLLHKVLGFYTPGGWQYQIQTDYELNLSAQYNKLLARRGLFDLTLNSYVNAGTGLSGAGAGLTLRFGQFNQLFNSATTNSTVSIGGITHALHKTEIFIHYQPLLNIVAYNATIQGSLFDSSPSVNEISRGVIPLVFSQEIGVDLVANHWVLGFYVITQTRDVDVMLIDNDQWGSIRVLYRF